MNMKKFLRFIWIMIVAFLVSCTEVGVDGGVRVLTPKDGSKQIELGYDISKSASYTFQAPYSWKIWEASNLLEISPKNGGSGDNTLKVKAVEYNCTNKPSTSTFTIDGSGNDKLTVTVNQQPVFRIDTLKYRVHSDKDTIDVCFDTDAPLTSSLHLYYDPKTDFMDMFDKGNASNARSVSGNVGKVCVPVEYSSTRAGKKGEYHITIPILANKERRARRGVFGFALDEEMTMTSDMIEVVQDASDIEHSTDMTSLDGKVHTLQVHKRGNKGVPIVLLGDGFLDKDIENGTYAAAMEEAYRYLFTVEPMTSLKDYFDVSYVTAVSYNNYFATGTSTAFSSVFAGGGSTSIEGNDDKAVNYAKKAVSGDRINDVLIIIVINDTRYAGTCSIYYAGDNTDVPNGYSIAYIPMTAKSETSDVAFEEVLHHEAVGHGFGKLADEYYYSENGSLTSAQNSEAKNDLVNFQKHGCFRNVDLHSDVTMTYWSELAADARYQAEKLSAYVGAYGFISGVYRPTKTSIMVDNVGGFNSPSRMMIYKRCMKIATGKVPSYEDFVTFDEPSRTFASGARVFVNEHKTVKPLGKPRVKKRF